MNVPTNGDVGGTDFRLEVLRRLDRIETQWSLGHDDVMAHVHELEKDLPRIRAFLNEWYGEDADDGGMRRVLRDMISERKTVSVGWRALLAIGGFITSIAAFVVAYMEHKAHGG